MKVTINGSMVDLDVGKKIVLLRMSKGFNRVSLAKQAGISTSCLEDIETGFTENPEVRAVQAIARALEVSVDFLYNTDVLFPGNAESEQQAIDLLKSLNIFPDLKKLAYNNIALLWAEKERRVKAGLILSCRNS